MNVRQDSRYLAGDIVTSGATVISAIAAGRRSAADIDAWLRSQRLSKKDMNRYREDPRKVSWEIVTRFPF
jgi:shikimate kinase